jgi:transcriptional regulator with XRE-family HTH domain
MAKPQIHWDAVAEAINERLPELHMTQQDLANAAGVSLTTVRDLRNNRGARRRSPRILGAISVALDWPTGKLDAIARGLEEPESTLEERVAKLEAEVAALRNKVDSGHSG